jgi:hypothetical protein
LEVIAMDNVGIFYGYLVILLSFGKFCGHLTYLIFIWYILWPLDIFNTYLVYFSRFGLLYQEQSGNPVSATKSDKKKLRTVFLFMFEYFQQITWRICSKPAKWDWLAGILRLKRAEAGFLGKKRKRNIGDIFLR